MDEDTGLGGRFWFVVLLLCVGAVVAVSVFVVIFTHLWYAWGVFGTFLVLGAGLLAFGWAFDRRERKRRERVAA
jgi:peptidoglycan/LPS O-acetylase OafA/YrhL